MVNPKKTAASELPDKGRCIIEFLAELETIKDQIVKGWPIKTIWSSMYESGTFSGGYRNFVKLVNGRILGVKNEPKMTPLSAQPKQVSTENGSKAQAHKSTIQPNTNLGNNTREPKKVTTFESFNSDGLGAKNANAIQDDLV
jgi:Family of unknown function (DUF5338)